MHNQSHKNRVETLLECKIRQQSKIEACGNHLKQAPKADRPSDAGMDAVRSAVMQCHESLIDCEETISHTNRVECPCVVLGADECRRE